MPEGAQFTRFRDACFDKPGFYVLKRKCDGKTLHCHCGTPRIHYGKTRSFFTTWRNDRDKDSCHDIGQYNWVGNPWDQPYHHYDEWREQTEEETIQTMLGLYHYCRPFWHYKHGKHQIPG